MLGGEETEWRILKNNFLAPSLYTDAILDSGRIYAVTEPRGDVLVWEPLEYGKIPYLCFMLIDIFHFDLCNIFVLHCI